MPDSTTSGSGFAELDRLGELFRRTRALLDETLAVGDLPPGGEALLSGEALPYIEAVEDGFRATLRAGQADLDELRGLVRRGGLGSPPRNASEARAALIEAMQAMAGVGGHGLVAFEGDRLTGLAHARLAFALLPRLRDDAVHYPAGLRSYADIAAPRSPTELAWRIEELERSLWHLAVRRHPRRGDPSYRRTYGFFDAGERLANDGLHLPD